MTVADEILTSIRACRLSPASVAKADADITLAIGREVERAKHIVAALTGRHVSTLPKEHNYLMAAMKQTTRWDGLSDDARRTITLALRETGSFEEAAELIRAVGMVAS